MDISKNLNRKLIHLKQASPTSKKQQTMEHECT